MQEAQGLKRKEPPISSAIVVSKKTKSDEIIAYESRTSNLKAPIMLLEGHSAEISAVKFSPDGQSIASVGVDKQIFLWEVFGDCVNYDVMKGHKNAILECCWSQDNQSVFTASADKTAAQFDVNRAKIVKRMVEHTSYVSSLSSAKNNVKMLATCSDDGTCKIWNTDTKASTITLPHSYPLTAVCLDDRAEFVYTGGIDNLIHCWDLRKPNTEVFRLLGHGDTITSLRLDPFGSYLLSNSMDKDVRVWDIRPFAPPQRSVKSFTGASHNFEQNLIKANWSADGSLVGSGSSDRMAYVWDTTTRQIKYKLPGHAGTVNEVSFHPTEPIIASCGADGKIFLGEIEKSIIEMHI
jgi:Prp8 binding protein